LNFDLIIIGGGIAALSTAWEAQQKGLKTCILYQQRTHSATQAAAGMLCPEIEADSAYPPLLKLAKKSQHLYPTWIQSLEEASGLPSGYHKKGTLLVAQHRDHIAEITQLQAHIAEQGFFCTRLTIQELRKKEEKLAPRLAGGIFVPEAYSIHPRMLYSMLHKILSPQLHMYTDIHIDHNNDKIIHVQYRDKDHIQQSIQAQQYIIADGAWTQHFSILNWLPQRPVKGQYIILEGAPLIEHTLRTPDVYMVPRPNGELYIGATMEEEGFCDQVRAGHQLDLLYHSWQFLRGIYELQIKESGVGFRPALRDHQPGIGPTQLKNLWLNIGHFRHGITIAPAASKLLLHMIEKPDTDAPFSPLRFWNAS
jgi:glycine oxidase